MNTDINTNTSNKRPTIKELWQDIKKHRKLYYKVLPITFVAIAFLTLSIPNYYRCTVMLAPELSTGNRANSSLASLASNFGINLNLNRPSVDAILPTLYPDLMNSVAFRASLFPVKVRYENDSTDLMTYYDYLKDHQKYPWWTTAIDAVFQVLLYPFKSKESDGNSEVNTFQLTKQQARIAKLIAKRVVCDVDKKTMAITINVTDQDPLICAIVADSVQNRLQEFITDYRTKKARIDLAYNKKLYDEARERYENARKAYASHADANRNVLFEGSQTEILKYQNEMNIEFQAYSQVVAQMYMAEAKVQEETPAFTTLQPASVPIKKAGPSRAKTCLAFLFLAFLISTAWIFNKEGHLMPFFSSDDE